MATKAAEDQATLAANGPERRCIASGAVRPADDLLRFVVGPAGDIVPDLARKLPGRGIWLGCDRNLLQRALDKRLFARAAKQRVNVDEDLPERVEAALRQTCLDLLGLARRAGQLNMGYEKVRTMLASGRAAIVVSAGDGSVKGRLKLVGDGRSGAENVALKRPVVITQFGVDELSLALGRENVVHAALQNGGLAQRFLRACRRLEEFRG